MASRQVKPQRTCKTVGSKAFCAALDKLRDERGKGAIGKLREAIGVSWQSWWAYRQGARRPSETIRRAIETLLGIPASAWMTPEERIAERARNKALKRAAA